jgi:UDP-3-O-[3-hydroxymyristoyl] glucosamine N-acyltransferase
MPFSAAEISQILGGQVLGDASLALKGFAPADHAQAGDLTFAENESYFARADQSAASAIIVDGDFTSEQKTLIRVPNARIAFAKAMKLFFPEPVFAAGVHATAIVPASATVDPTAHLGPYCVLDENVRIGPRCVLRGGNHIGANCQLGEEVHLFPNVTLYANTEAGNRVRIHSGAVIGADGFGYVLDEGSHRKVPQIGKVILGDDVEIGANVTIDRGALGPTIIGKGTKIDNLVQIAHNVVVGEHCLIVSQAGVAGSAKLGNYVILAGQVGIAGHLKIGDHVSVGAQSGVMHDIPAGQMWLWTPALPNRQAKRQMLAMQELPDMLRRFIAVEKKLGLKAELTPAAGPDSPEKR